MSRIAKLLGLAMASLLACGVADGQTKRPDFSGVWKLDMKASEFGNIPGGRPTARVDSIDQGPAFVWQVLYLDNGGKKDTTVYRYTTDGVECVNRVAGSEIKSVVSWEGDSLRVESRTKLMVFDMTLSEVWRLSSDGRTLMMDRIVKYPLGKGKQALVFAKQASEETPAVVAPARKAPPGN